MKNFCLYILFYTLCFSILGQTKIKLYAPSYKGKYATINTSIDYITFNKRKIDKQKIDSLGYAIFNIKEKESIKTTIEISNASAILYLDSKTKYYSVFFPKLNLEYQKLHRNYVELLYDKLPKDDLNTLILDFNYRIDEMLFGDSIKMQKLILQDDSFKNNINYFKKELIKDYRPIKNKYFHQYVKYSIAELELLYLARGMIKNKIYLFETYIGYYPILYKNDAYMKFFKQYFGGFFQSNIGLYDKIKHSINNYSSVEKLDEVLSNSPFLKNDSIRELVSIINLYESYYKNSFNSKNIIVMLNNINKKSSIKEHIEITSNMLYNMQLLTTGSKAPKIELINSKNDTISLSNFKGKYIYLQFFTTKNQRALQELKIMKELYDKYNKHIKFISISVDDNELDFINFVNKNYKYNWNFAHYKGENKLLEDYKIMSVPSYVLIDEYGNIEQAQAMSPSPNYPKPSIDKTFFYIKKKREPKNNKNIGSKEN